MGHGDEARTGRPEGQGDRHPWIRARPGGIVKALDGHHLLPSSADTRPGPPPL